MENVHNFNSCASPIFTLNIDQVRKNFPALLEAQAENRIFLENAGGSQVLKSVADKILDYLLHTNVQLGATYRTSVVSTNRVMEGLEAVRTFLNARSTSEIFMGPSTSQLLRNLCQSMAPTLQPDSEIILTNTDHESNIGPYLDMAQSRGCTVKFWKVNPKTLLLDIADLKALLSRKTRFVAMTHCSNVLGTINDVKRVAQTVHAIPNAEIAVDGVAYAAHRRIDVQELDVDYYALSWYKVYGPHVSTLYARASSVAKLSSPARYFYGGTNYELTYSLTAVLSYLVSLSPPNVELNTSGLLDKAFSLVTAQEHVLTSHLLRHLLSIPNVFIVGNATADPELRVATVSFVIPNKSSRDIVERVEAVTEGKVGIRWGNFYAKRLVDDVLGLEGQDGVVRVSMVHYNTVEEVDKVGEVLKKVVGAAKF